MVKHKRSLLTSRRCARLLATLVLSAGCAGPRAAVIPSTPPAGNDAVALFARFKQVTGGDRWDRVASMTEYGRVFAGGLAGESESRSDLRDGRFSNHWTLGSVGGASGFDGTHDWRQSVGGEVSVLDGADARELSVTDRWQRVNAAWYPSRGAASYGAVETRDEGGKRYRIVTATPAGGRAVTFWFDDASGLVVRSSERAGGGTTSTVVSDDYRDVGGLRVSFHSIADVTDAAGRTDPRNRYESRLDRVVFAAPLDASAFAMPAMSGGARIADGSGTTRVPFELINNHIYANVTIDGKTAHVIVDTGGDNVLTPEAAARLGLRSEGKLAGGGVGDERVDSGLAHAGEVRLGGALLPKPVFSVIPFGQLPAGEGTTVDGLVGFEMFRRFRVTVDYAAHVLTLTEPKQFTPPTGAHVVPFEMSNTIPIVSGMLDGQPVRLEVDTGSRLSLTMFSPYVRAHDLVALYAAAPETVVGWGIGGGLRSRPARLGTLTLGDLTIPDVGGYLYLGTKGGFADPDLAGNLGSGVLRRFNVTFDYDAHKMYLVPNADFARPDLYDRSGTWLFSDGDALQVMALAPDGPALRAGLAEGDRILRVDGEPVSRRSLDGWRAQLRERAAGTRITLSIHRGTVDKTVSLTLADQIPPRAAKASAGRP